jgi:hypothetical protein
MEDAVTKIFVGGTALFLFSVLFWGFLLIAGEYAGPLILGGFIITTISYFLGAIIFDVLNLE